LAVEENLHNLGDRLAAFHDLQVITTEFLRQPAWQQVEIGVANQFLLFFKFIQLNQILIGRQKHPFAILGKKGDILNTVEKMIDWRG
jgi:hypothetical protein